MLFKLLIVVVVDVQDISDAFVLFLNYSQQFKNSTQKRSGFYPYKILCFVVYYFISFIQFFNFYCIHLYEYIIFFLYKFLAFFRTTLRYQILE